MIKLTEKTNKTVRTVYGWLLAAFTVITGALFVWQVLDIYLSGIANGSDSPFSYELVVERVAGVLAAPFWIWIALIVVGFIVWEVFPVRIKRDSMTDPVYILNRLKKKLPAEVKGKSSIDSLNVIYREELTNKVLRTFCILTGIAFTVYAVVYLATPANFPNVSKTSDMLNMARHILTCAALLFAFCCATAFYEWYSAKLCLPHAKKLVAANRSGKTAPATVCQTVAATIKKIISHKYFVLGVRIAVGCFGVTFVILGCLNGSVGEVFNKAIRICTECIGLG